MAENVDVLAIVSSLLDSGNYKEALTVPNEEKYSEKFKDCCWDLVSLIVGKVDDNTMTLKPSLHGTCEELLSLIIQKTTPEEALLEFIEQIEVAKNDAQFSLVLTPLQNLLKKLTIKRGRSLEWCLNSISTYIETIPVTEHTLEGKERLLLDSDPSIRRISKVFSMLPQFYIPFIEELDTHDANKNTKQIVVAFLISLLGRPLIYIDLDPETNSKSELKMCCNLFIKHICQLEKNVLKFLDYIELCYKENKKIKSKSSESDYGDRPPYEHKEKVNLTTLSGLHYVVFSSHFDIPEKALPQVYSIEYVVHTALYAVVHLLSFAEYGPLSKAISLCSGLLKLLPEKCSSTFLSYPMHFDVIKGLVSVAIYSAYDSIRKKSVNLIRTYVNKFEYKGRCNLIKYIIDTSNHSGMIGFAITLYKNSLNEAFEEFPLHNCFSGPQLCKMIKKICHLPHGAESDLVELADQIITCLNFLRFLALKDIDNRTGIKDCFSFIEDFYLAKLRIGLNMSKAHYEVKLKDIQEGKEFLESSINISLNVGGNILDQIPIENKKETIYSALNAFHLMEGLVARLSECINVNKMQNLKMVSIRNTHKLILPLSYAPISNPHRINTRNYSQQKEEELQKLPVSSFEDEKKYEENLKNIILERAFEFVPTSGWTMTTLNSAATAVGYPKVINGIFPNGPGDLVHFFNVRCNELLVEQMQKWPNDLKDHHERVPAKFIENAIMTRLCMIEPYKSTWARALAIQASPANVPNSLATLLSLVDDICFYSGDRSVDFNWYVRRVGLAGIYKASELYYLTDASFENAATRNFVMTRIKDAEMIQGALSLNPVSAAPQALSAAFVTAKNMLGINTPK